MDVASSFARDTIAHWEYKTTRVLALRVLLTIALVFKPLINYTFNHLEITIGWLGFFAIAIPAIMLGFSIAEYIVSNKTNSTFGRHVTSNAHEYIMYFAITALTSSAYHLHLRVINFYLWNLIQMKGCKACTTTDISKDLLSIGRSYIDVFFATLLTVATIWSISPHMIFLYSRKTAVATFLAKYICWAALTGGAMWGVWWAYCQGGTMCYGNVAVAAWSLVVGGGWKGIDYLKAIDYERIVGTEALKHYAQD